MPKGYRGRFFWDLIKDRLKATKIGKGSLRIFRDSIDALIQQNRKDHWNLAISECR